MSLRSRLLLTLGLTLAILWGLAAAWQLRDLHAQVEQTLDKRLAQSARMVAGLLEQLPTDAWDQVDRTALSIPPIEGLACQVHSPRGEVIARTHSEMDTILAPGSSGYSYREEAGTTWRVFTYQHDGLTITTADRMDERDILLRDVIKVAVVPFLAALVGSMIALWFGILRGLKPIARLRDALAQRHPDALEPLNLQGTPNELRPLIGTLNTLLIRVRQAMIREQRFTSDAAHELRTPLTAIKTHLQVARRVDGDAAKNALNRAEEGVARLARTLEQLLLLARVEGRLTFEDGEACTIKEVIALAVRDAGPPAQTDRVHVQGPLPGTELGMPRELAVAALRNLIDNALRHSGSDEPIAVEASWQEGELESSPRVNVCVRNPGPWVEDATLENLTERFWRASQHHGSGLGLAIVSAIAERFEGELSFSRPPDGGLQACISLPGRDTGEKRQPRLVVV